MIGNSRELASNRRGEISVGGRHQNRARRRRERVFIVAELVARITTNIGLYHYESCYERRRIVLAFQ